MPDLVGTSGWVYAHWRGDFYPDDLRQADELPHYAARFPTVEVNATFYVLPTERTVAQWAARTPPSFTFAVKASRYLTHVLRLRDPEEPVRLFCERLRGLGPRLGPVLLQLPPTFRRDDARLDRALRAFPGDLPLAVEFRHESWFHDDVYGLLETRRAALCLADRRSRWVTPLVRTADFAYVRFHHGAGAGGGYGARAIDERARAVASLWPEPARVFAYFNNDTGGHAPVDALAFTRALARARREGGAGPIARAPGLAAPSGAPPSAPSVAASRRH